MFVRKLKLSFKRKVSKKKNKFNPVSNFHSGPLLNQVTKIKKETYFEYLLQPSFKISLNFGRRVFTFRDI
jgi:hypothetical protein